MPAAFETPYAGAPRTFAIALDEAVQKGEGGETIPLKLDPPATLETLAARLAALPGEVFPVCYESEKPHEARFRKVITRDLTLKLADGKEMPELPAGIVLKERPAYAPQHAIVTAATPLAAIAALKSLAALPGVESVELQLAAQKQTRAMPNDPQVPQMWHLKYQGQSNAVSGTDVNIEGAWGYGTAGGYRGAGIRIGIVDDGLQTAHPDLAANVDTTIDKDFNGNDDDPNPGATDNHGTCCAGNAAAVGNNGLGVCGTAPEAKLVGLRLIGTGFTVTDSQEADAMSYRNDVIQIKSNSWGPDDDGKTLEGPGSLARAAFQTASTSGRGGLGTIFLWAAGNGGDVDDNSNYDGYANDIHTIAIGGNDSLGHQAYYSEKGANLVVVAPTQGQAATSRGIITTDRTGTSGYNTTNSSAGDYYASFNGTSSSTPTAAGVVALILQRNPNLGWRDVKEILIASAKKIDPSDSDWSNNAAGYHFNHRFGAGLIDATAAVNLAATWTNLPAAGSQTVSDGPVSITIPDNNSAGVTRTFSFSGTNRRVEHVEVTFSASHKYRGDLTVTLTSPSGTESRLAEEHSDNGDDYASWKFSSVRHWGETSNGIWTLKIADRDEGVTGTYTASSITISGPPANPAPVVAIASPAASSSFPNGNPVNVSVNASDINGNGTAGTIASVQLLDNGTPVATDTVAPFSFSITPALGSHSLTAIATDGQGATTTSAAVSISVVPSSYDTWITNYPSLANKARNADPDKDGMENLLEHYFGSDPGKADAPLFLPVAGRSGNSLTLTWWHSKAATSPVATVEWSQSLGTWSTVGISTAVITDLPGKERLRATLPLPPGDHVCFLRLRVE